MPDPIPTTPSAVPPPSTEVIVRTLASDVAAIAAGGGTATVPPQGVTVLQPHPINAGSESHLVSSILSWLAVFIALIALAGGSWFGYRYLTRTTTATVPGTATTTLPVSPTVSSTGPLAALPQTVPTHKSLLTKAAPTTVSFPLVAPAGTLKTRFQLMREGLDKVPASVRVAELVPTDAVNKPLSFPGYATTVGAPDLMDRDAFSTYIQDDFTLLAVRGEGGFSAAYIFTLKPNTAWLYAEPGVRTIETAPSLTNLFLQIPGTQSASFADATIAEQPVRSASYENPAGTMTYGFFRDRLIISTSRAALDETLRLLCFAPGSC